MPRVKTPKRSRQLRNSPSAKTPGWTAASEDLFAEPLQTPSPFKNRVLTRRTSVYVKNIHKARGILESQELKSIAKEKNGAKNTRKQTTVKKYSEITISPEKNKTAQGKSTSVSSKSAQSASSTNSAANQQKRNAASSANSKENTSAANETKENIKSKRLTKSKKMMSVSPKRNKTPNKQRESVKFTAKSSDSEAKFEKATMSTEKVKDRSQKPLSPKSIKPNSVVSPIIRKSRKTARSVKQLSSEVMMMNVSRENTPSSVTGKTTSFSLKNKTNEKQASPKLSEVNSSSKIKSLRTPSTTVTPLMKKSKTETFSTPESTSMAVAKSMTTSVLMKARTPMTESPRAGRKTVRITVSENRTPRTPIQRQATPGRLNSRSRPEEGSAVISVSKKRKVSTTEVHSVTPIKAARILGKVISSTKKMPKKPKSLSPQTSTPTSGEINKRPAMTAPPVSEIRRSKRTKRDTAATVETFTAVDAIPDICMSSVKTPEKENEAVKETMVLKEHSQAVILASEKNSSWWGYCTIL